MSNSDTADQDRDIPGPDTLPPGVGSRFHADGSARTFPGNTIICHVPPGPIRDGLFDLHGQLSALDFAASLTLLPPASWHMTVFEGVCGEVRTPGKWPADLGYDAPLEACDALYAMRLEGFELETEPPFRLQISGVQPITAALGLSLGPADIRENFRLRTLRNRLSTVLGLRHPNHETYGFHISLGYLIRYLSAGQVQHVTTLVLDWAARQPMVELGIPEFCTFQSMCHFERQFYLGSAREQIQD